MGGKKNAPEVPAAPAFETLPIVNGSRRDGETGAPIPDVSDVRQAKKWVDENKL